MAAIGRADGASNMTKGPTEKKSRNNFDVPAVAAPGSGRALRALARRAADRPSGNCFQAKRLKTRRVL